MNLRPFELSLVIIFGGLALLALVMLAWYEPPENPNNDGPQIEGSVTIWGTLPAESVNGALKQISGTSESFRNVRYRSISPERFDAELLDALAERRQPDLILISHKRLVQHRSKLYPISYESFPLRDYRNLYVDGAELFSRPDGIYAFPIAVDPLMMYWNRNLLADLNYLTPPATWEELVGEYAPAATVRDDRRRLQRSAVAMGTYDNIRNPVATISMLFTQGGSQLVREERDQYWVMLNESVGGGAPLTDALRFYTRFADASNPLYSWNRSQPEDRQQFVREELAFYFGFGSEARRIAELNPNLNFDIAEVPQGATASVRRTYGRFYGLALLRTSNNPVAAQQVLYQLANSQVATGIANGYGMAPPHVSVIAAGSNDIYGRLIYTSVPIARGWLNPDRDQTEQVFADAIANINANRRDPVGAADDITTLLRNRYE